MAEKRADSPGDEASGSEASLPPGEGRAPYEPPRLEHLGPWQAFTLQQSVPISP